MKNNVLQEAIQRECDHLLGMYTTAKNKSNDTHWGDESFNYCPFCGVDLVALREVQLGDVETLIVKQS